MKSRFQLISPLTIIAVTFAATIISVPFAEAQAQRGTLVHEETMRVAPSVDSAKVGEAQRGRELIILDTSRDWVHVQAILRPPSHDEGATEEEEEGKTNERRVDEARDQEISRHEVGRSRRFSHDREQALRRVGRSVEVSG
jgi:hypothetical protein